MADTNSESAEFGKCPKCKGKLIYSLTWTTAVDSEKLKLDDASYSAACRSCKFIVEIVRPGMDFTLLSEFVANLLASSVYLYKQYARAIQLEKLKTIAGLN